MWFFGIAFERSGRSHFFFTPCRKAGRSYNHGIALEDKKKAAHNKG